MCLETEQAKNFQDDRKIKYRNTEFKQRLSGKETTASIPHPYRESKDKISWKLRQGRDRTLMLRQWTAPKTICFYSLLTLVIPILSKSGLMPYKWGKWETAGSLVHVRAGTDPLLWQRHSPDGWQEESLFLIKLSWAKKAKMKNKLHAIPSAFPHSVGSGWWAGGGFPDEKGHINACS